MRWGIIKWYQGEIAVLDRRVKADRHIGLNVWHAIRMVSGSYMHFGYMHAYHYIVFVVTSMVYAS